MAKTRKSAKKPSKKRARKKTPASKPRLSVDEPGTLIEDLMENTEQRLFTVEHGYDYYRAAVKRPVSLAKFTTLIEDDLIHARRVGRELLVRKTEIDRYIETEQRKLQHQSWLSLPVFMTPAQVADVLQISVKELEKAHKAGEVPGGKLVGKQLRFSREALIRWAHE